MKTPKEMKNMLKKHISGYRGNIKQSDAISAMEEYGKEQWNAALEAAKEKKDLFQYVEGGLLWYVEIDELEKLKK